MVVVEKYPDLKSNQNFLALQSQLEGTENRIAVARRDYVGAVQQYNVELRTFPGNIWHKILYSGLAVRETYEATSANADKAPAGEILVLPLRGWLQASRWLVLLSLLATAAAFAFAAPQFPKRSAGA